MGVSVMLPAKPPFLQRSYYCGRLSAIAAGKAAIPPAFP
jgi:hypothetical protein